jgi:hypothetical protein
MDSFKRFFLILGILVFVGSFVVPFIYGVEDLLALQGNVLQGDLNLESGNLTVYIFDAQSGGNVIYNSSDEFENAISDGKYDVLVGNSSSNPLSLDYGDKYYIEMYVNDEQLTFGGAQRQIFQSSVGNVSSLKVSVTDNGEFYNATDVENVLQEIGSRLGGTQTVVAVSGENISTVWKDPVLDKDLSSPPGTPSDEARYIISPGADWYNHAWLYRRQIDTDSSKVTLDEDNGIMKVEINGADSLFGNAQSDGDDIVFTDSDGTTKLNHHLERYDEANTIFVATVNIPNFDADATDTIYMYYNNSLAQSQENTEETFPTDYGLYFDMGSTNDLTRNERDVVSVVGNPASDDGTYGKGMAFDGSDGWSMKDMPYWEQKWDTRTHNIVFETGADVNTRQVLFAEGANINGVMLYILNGDLYARWWSESRGWNGDYHSTGISANTVYYVTMSYDYPGNYILYVNGVEIGSSATSAYMNAHSGDGGIGYTGRNAKDFHDGYLQGHYFVGTIREFFISDNAWDENKHDTWYNNRGDNGNFWSVGAESTPAGATGDWSGHDNEIAQYNSTSSSWSFVSPSIGWAAFVQDEGIAYWWNGFYWGTLTTGVSHLTLDDLDGGDDDLLEYYHLSQSEYDAVRRTASETEKGLMPAGKLTEWDLNTIFRLAIQQFSNMSIPFFDENNEELIEDPDKFKYDWTKGELRAPYANFSGTVYINNETDISTLTGENIFDQDLNTTSNVTFGQGSKFGEEIYYYTFGKLDMESIDLGSYVTLKGVNNDILGNITTIENAIIILGGKENHIPLDEETTSLPTLVLLDERETSPEPSMIIYNYSDKRLDFLIGGDGSKLFKFGGNLNISAGNDICIEGGNCLSTSATWDYNQSLNVPANSTIISISNVTDFLYNYNQTQPAIDLLNNTYGQYWYNHTEVGEDLFLKLTGGSLSGQLNVTSGGMKITGDVDFNGGWQVGGVTVSEGAVFLQTLYAYNITSLGVNNLDINGSLLPIGWNNTFDVGNETYNWRTGHFATEVYVKGDGISKWMYNQSLNVPANSTTLSISNITNFNYNYNQSFEANKTIYETYNSAWGSIYNVSYVPYTGATTNVNLGVYNLTTASGRIGIGTTTPNSRLNIRHTTEYINSNPNQGNMEGITLSNQNQGANTINDILFEHYSLVFDGEELSFVGLQNISRIRSARALGNQFLTESQIRSDILLLQTFNRNTSDWNSDQFVLLGDGTVGVGTRFPDYTFSINGTGLNVSNSSNSAFICLNGDCLSEWSISGGENIFNQDLNTTNSVRFNNLTLAGNLSIGSNKFFVNPDTGRVGIGTALPNDELTVKGNMNVSGYANIGGGTRHVVDVITSTAGFAAGYAVAGRVDGFTTWGSIGYNGITKRYAVYGSQGNGTAAGYFAGNVTVTEDILQGDGDIHYFGDDEDGKIYWDNDNERLVIKVS